MIKTVDGVECGRGDRVWEIGMEVNGTYRPTMSVVDSRTNNVCNPDRCWKDYDLCLAESEKKNKEAFAAEMLTVVMPKEGLDVAYAAYKRKENPFGQNEPQRNQFENYNLYERYLLQWKWWNIELGINPVAVAGQ